MACTLFHMGENLVVRSKRPAKDGFPAVESSATTISVDRDRDRVREACAELLAAGFSCRKVSESMVSHLSPTSNPRSAFHKLRRWMKRDPAFRDMIFSKAVIKLDLDSPNILAGISRKAQDGRVDAARLALEITGRHTSHEAQVTSVTVNLNNIPRPDRR